MKFKILTFFLISILFISFCGCIGTDSDSNPLYSLNKKIEKYEPDHQNIPANRTVVQVNTGNCSIVPYSAEDYLEKSDIICYATIQSISAPEWNTPNRQTPASFEEAIQNSRFNPRFSHNTGGLFDGYHLYTNITFIVENDVKNTMKGQEIEVCILGGEFDEYYALYYESQNPFDFKEGDEYLLYLTKESQECVDIPIDGENQYFIMRGGAYKVSDFF